MLFGRAHGKNDRVATPGGEPPDLFPGELRPSDWRRLARLTRSIQFQIRRIRRDLAGSACCFLEFWRFGLWRFLWSEGRARRLAEPCLRLGCRRGALTPRQRSCRFSFARAGWGHPAYISERLGRDASPYLRNAFRFHTTASVRLLKRSRWRAAIQWLISFRSAAGFWVKGALCK